MTTQSLLPGIPESDPTYNRHGGNEHSNEAWKNVEPFAGSVRSWIEHFILGRGSFGATSAEIEIELRRAKNRFSGRITQLKAEGKIVEQGTRDGCGILIHRVWAEAK
jgi:hypothetical protein